MKYLKITFKICFALIIMFHNGKAAQESFEADQHQLSLRSSKRSNSQTTSSSSQDQPLDKKLKENKDSHELALNPQVRECGIWRNNLNYVYEGVLFPTYGWHIQTALVIKEKKERSHSNTNFAKIRIEAVFRKSKSSPSSFVQIYEPEFMFSTPSTSYDRDSINLGDFITIYEDDPKALEFLKQLYGADLKLDWDFRKRSHHTDIAILFDIFIRQYLWIEKIKPEDNTSKLDYLVLSICSYFDPCDTCASHLYRAGKSDGFFLKGIRKALESYKKDFRVSKKMRLFINVSSLNSYEGSQPLPPLPLDNIKLPSLKTREYYPFFAQMRLNFATDPMTPSWGSLSSIPQYALVQDSNPLAGQAELKPPAG